MGIDCPECGCGRKQRVTGPAGAGGAGQAPGKQKSDAGDDRGKADDTHAVGPLTEDGNADQRRCQRHRAAEQNADRRGGRGMNGKGSDLEEQRAGTRDHQDEQKRRQLGR
ncbi:hypothetical protein D9M70_651880 [compost metagenome]